MRKAIRYAWNYIAWVELVSGTSKKSEIITESVIRHRGCIYHVFLQPENLRTWQLYMIVDFQFHDRSTSTDIVLLWSLSKDTLCKFSIVNFWCMEVSSGLFCRLRNCLQRGQMMTGLSNSEQYFLNEWIPYLRNFFRFQNSGPWSRRCWATVRWLDEFNCSPWKLWCHTWRF